MISSRMITRTLLAAFALTVLAASANAAPLVANVRASQRTDGTGTVDIYYDLSGATGAVVVSAAISNDSGATYNIIPSPSRISGDVGAGVVNGSDRHIIWDTARDRPQIFWPNCRARVTVAGQGQVVAFTLAGGVALELIKIPAATFYMGSNIDDGWSNSSEYPRHLVTVQDYYIGKFEVTQDQWVGIMGTNPSNCTYGCGGDFPVQTVSWNTIQTFLTQLNAQGLGGTFRLPSEAEWEYAARGGTQTRFPFGASDCLPNECTTVCDLGNYAIYCANDANKAVAVGSKLPNAFGLYDTMGNIWEWVEDDYHGSYVGAPNNGIPWIESPRGTYRVLRGGAWDNAPTNCRPAYRINLTPSYTNTFYGFRLAWTP